MTFRRGFRTFQLFFYSLWVPGEPWGGFLAPFGPQAPKSNQKDAPQDRQGAF